MAAIETVLSSGDPDITNTVAMTGAVSGAHLGLSKMNLPAGMAHKLTDRGDWYDTLLIVADNTCTASEQRYDGLSFMASLCTNSNKKNEGEDFYQIATDVENKPIAVLKMDTLCRPRIKIREVNLLECTAHALVIPDIALGSSDFWPPIADELDAPSTHRVKRERLQHRGIEPGQVVVAAAKSNLWQHILMHAALIETIAVTNLAGEVTLQQRTDTHIVRHVVGNALMLAMTLQLHSLAFAPMVSMDQMQTEQYAETVLYALADFIRQAPELCLDRIELLLTDARDIDVYHKVYCKIFQFK